MPLFPPALTALGKRQELGLVFTFSLADGRRGQPGPNVVSKWFKKTAKAAGLGWARLHDLRHTWVTYLVYKGVSLRWVQEWAGHSSIRTTEGYAKRLVATRYQEALKIIGQGTKPSRKD